MKLIRLWLLGCLVVLVLAPLAQAQQFIPLHAGGAGEVFSLAPLAGAGGVNAFAGAPTLTAQGTVAGRATDGQGNIEIGFDYIRPLWTTRDFTLAVPDGVGGFPLLADAGHVDNRFALAPHLNFKYDVSDIFAIKATGSFMNLSGHLNRTLTPNNGTAGVLTANSSLTIVSANLPEIATRFFYDELMSRRSHLYWSIFDDMTIDLGIGTRYSSVEQNYTGKLTNTLPGGTNQSQRYSYQNFKGVGLTSSLNFTLPFHERPNGERWNAFTNVRGSILVGENNKDSSIAVTLAGMPSVADSITQSRTEFIPVGELEVGVEWIHFFGDANDANVPRALFSVRMGFTGQVWGNVGPLSAGSAQGFRTSNLFLVGAHIMVGLAR